MERKLNQLLDWVSTLSQAFSLAAILVFVFGAPVIMTEVMGGNIGDFILLQVCGIANFILASNLSSKLAGRFGVERMIFIGTTGLFAGFALILAYVGFGGRSLGVIIPVWVITNAGFGIRGPIGFHQAIIASKGDHSRGAALVVASILGFTAAGTAAAAAGLAWMFFDVVKGKKPSVLGFCIGAVVGLVAITPAAGFVGIPQSIIIGVVGALISNIAVGIKQKSKLDDTLDVFPCHGLGGIVGMLLTGVFANQLAHGIKGGPEGWFYGNASFFFTQFKAMAIVVVYSFTVSFLIFKFINFVLPLRVTEEEEELGLDESQHNEKYVQGTLLVNGENGKLVEKPVEF